MTTDLSALLDSLTTAPKRELLRVAPRGQRRALAARLDRAPRTTPLAIPAPRTSSAA